MSRRAVRCAVIRDDMILMVRVAIDGRTWWVLPGGGVEPGETDEQAALRELREETQLSGTDPRWLCDLPDPCFLVTVAPDAEPVLDMDPSLPDSAEIVAVEWRRLEHVARDLQVRQVLAALRS